ncbi:toluene tolerance protein, partial [Pseudomonas frederiksbergensis]|nr:toluene tolerance protein [Pseudomonas frederiksbergensis]
MSILRRGLLVLLAALPLMAGAAAQSPKEVIEKTTSQLLSDLKTNKEQYKADPGAVYGALNANLGPVVGADGISKSIMAVKYSRQASPAQMQR